MIHDIALCAEDTREYGVLQKFRNHSQQERPRPEGNRVPQHSMYRPQLLLQLPYRV